MEFHSQPIEDILKEFNSSEKGLNRFNYLKNVEKYGSNEIKKEKNISALQILLSQLKGMLIYILFAAIIISAIIGEYIDAIVIFAILIINSIVGFIQEFKAEKAIEALQRLASLKAKVIREGKEQRVDVKEIVPGDIIVVETGDKIPADSRIIESIHLETQEASLTGESMPVKKEAGKVDEETMLAERSNMLYSTTIVTRGKAKAIVTATGMATEIGKIAKMVQSQERKLTPLQQKLAVFGKKLGYGCIAICMIVFIVGALRWGNIFEMFIIGIALAVAAIPEGLPIVVTISLALGTKRMLKKNALMRRLSSVETLGSVTVICSDKTGTFTKNEMTVKKLYANDKIIDVTGSGYKATGDFLYGDKKIDPQEFELLLKIGALNNDSSFDKEEVIGDPTEACLLVSARKAGINIESLKRNYPRIDVVEFSSERKRMTTVHQAGKKKVIFTKGAPDVLIELCDRILINGNIKKLKQEDKKKILDINYKLASGALRVLAFAYKEYDHKDNLEKNLVFVGLQGMIDPPREEVKEAVAKCREAGIRVIMITGDNPHTAKAIANTIGIEGECITGKELEKIALEKEVNDISIYARVDPSHKMQIIEALQKKNHIVAMTGDGVNDAPALKRADIGIAMGKTGSDVAKEAGDMILLDDNFASIVRAVEEGRTIFDNIKKFIIYLLSSNLGEVLTLVVGIIIGLPLPVVALQILWINIATDSLPALALGVEKEEDGIMKSPPRKPEEKLIDIGTGSYMFLIGMIMMIGTLGLFYFYVTKGGWHFGEFMERGDANYIYATSVAFTTLMMLQMFNVINCKTLKESIFKEGIFSNRWLIGAIVFSVGLQIAVLYTPLSNVFHTTALSWMDWVYILIVSSSVFWTGEIIKFIKSRHEN